MKHSLGDGIHHLVDLLGDLGEFAFVGEPVCPHQSDQLIVLSSVGPDEL